MALKVTLINPRSKSPGEIKQKCFAPVNLMYLASSLLKAGFKVEIIDANALGVTDDEVVRRVKNSQADLVGIALLSEILRPVYLLTLRIKETYPECKIALGGPGASALPEMVLDEFEAADYLLKGEAEESIVSLCRALEGGKDLSVVNGLYYRANGKIVKNAPAAQITDLDKLPHPARHLLDELYLKKSYYLILTRERPVDTIITSRGCPFSCRFCCNTGSEYRARSPENVLEEIELLYSRGIRNIDIADANFTFNRARSMRIFELMIKAGLGISFRMKSRADSIDEELVRKAKEAGAYLVSMGMESGSQKILEAMSKGTKVEKNIEACRMVMRADLKLNTGWIIGFPGETPQTIAETIDMIGRIRPTTASINALVPYPETEVCREALSNGTLQGRWSAKSDYTPWIKLPWTNSYADLDKAVSMVKKRVYYHSYYVSNIAREIVSNLNIDLARYAFQEFIRSCRR